MKPLLTACRYIAPLCCWVPNTKKKFIGTFFSSPGGTHELGSDIPFTPLRIVCAKLAAISRRIFPVSAARSSSLATSFQQRASKIRRSAANALLKFAGETTSGDPRGGGLLGQHQHQGPSGSNTSDPAAVPLFSSPATRAHPSLGQSPGRGATRAGAHRLCLGCAHHPAPAVLLHRHDPRLSRVHASGAGLRRLQPAERQGRHGPVGAHVPDQSPRRAGPLVLLLGLAQLDLVVRRGLRDPPHGAAASTGTR